MSSRSSRIQAGIESLVRHLSVELPDEAEHLTDEREANGIAFVTEFLERYDCSVDECRLLIWI